MSWRFNRSAVFLSLAILAPVHLGAQVTPTDQAALKGTIRDVSKEPVAGVEVVVPAANKRATTDNKGYFVLGGLAHGIHRIVVRSIGYRPISLRAYLVAYDTLDVDLVLTMTPVELEPLEVTATAIPIGLDDFERRRMEGFGQFVDWTSLRQQDFRPTRDIFRGIPGVRLKSDRGGRTYLASSRGDCPMQVYLDGIPIYRPDSPVQGPPPAIDQWSVTDFDAIEVYRGASETPIEFSGRGAGCGTVLLWSRRH